MGYETGSSKSLEEVLLESLPDGLLVADATGRIIRINSTLERMLGYSRAEFLNMTVEELIPTRYREVHRKHRASYAANPETRAMRGNNNLRALAKNGAEIPVDIMLAWVQDGEGGQMIAIIRDMTEVRAAHQAITESEARYRHIVETAQEGVVYVTAAETAVFANGRMASMLGYSVDEMLGRQIWDFVRESEVEKVRSAVSCWHVGSEPIEVLFRRSDARDVWGMISVSPDIDSEGQYKGWLGMVTDSTGRKRLQTQLAQASRLESVGKVSAVVAHDFNNLLTVINGQADLALSRVSGDNSLLAQLHAIRKAGHYAQDLTRDLLRVSRNPAGERRELDLNDFVRESSDFLQHVVGVGIVLSIETSAAPAHVNADADKLRQALVNLAVNARDAMPGGGRLTIRTGLETRTRAEAGESRGAAFNTFATLTVTDNGQGMDQETAQHIFEPFFTTKGPREGTGLGLSTVHDIMEQHGGCIDVSSAINQGTSFKLCFPALTEDRVSRLSSGAEAKP